MVDVKLKSDNIGVKGDNKLCIGQSSSNWDYNKLPTKTFWKTCEPLKKNKNFRKSLLCCCIEIKKRQKNKKFHKNYNKKTVESSTSSDLMSDFLGKSSSESYIVFKKQKGSLCQGDVRRAIQNYEHKISNNEAITQKNQNKEIPKQQNSQIEKIPIDNSAKKEAEQPKERKTKSINEAEADLIKSIQLHDILMQDIKFQLRKKLVGNNEAYEETKATLDTSDHNFPLRKLSADFVTLRNRVEPMPQVVSKRVKSVTKNVYFINKIVPPTNNNVENIINNEIVKEPENNIRICIDDVEPKGKIASKNKSNMDKTYVDKKCESIDENRIDQAQSPNSDNGHTSPKINVKQMDNIELSNTKKVNQNIPKCPNIKDVVGCSPEISDNKKEAKKCPLKIEKCYQDNEIDSPKICSPKVKIEKCIPKDKQHTSKNLYPKTKDKDCVHEPHFSENNKMNFPKNYRPKNEFDTCRPKINPIDKSNAIPKKDILGCADNKEKLSEMSLIKHFKNGKPVYPPYFNTKRCKCNDLEKSKPPCKIEVDPESDACSSEETFPDPPSMDQVEKLSDQTISEKKNNCYPLFYYCDTTHKWILKCANGKYDIPFGMCPNNHPIHPLVIKTNNVQFTGYLPFNMEVNDNSYMYEKCRPTTYNNKDWCVYDNAKGKYREPPQHNYKKPPKNDRDIVEIEEENKRFGFKHDEFVPKLEFFPR